MKRYALGVDLGGTNIAVGLVDEDHHIVDHLSRKTNLPRPEEEVEQSIAEICRELVARNDLSFEQDIRWIGIGKMCIRDRHNYTHGTVLAVHKQCNVFVNAYLWNLFSCIVLSPAERHGDNTAIGQSDACTFFVFNRIAYSSKSGANAAGKFDCKAVFHVRNYTKRTGWLLPFPGSIDPARFRKR